jgi:hypothetical protein
MSEIHTSSSSKKTLISGNTQLIGNVGIGDIKAISKLSVGGKISITSESLTPDAPEDGKGYLYTKDDGKIYWRSYDIDETDLTGGGGGSGIVNNRIDGDLTIGDDDSDGTIIAISSRIYSSGVAGGKVNVLKKINKIWTNIGAFEHFYSTYTSNFGQTSESIALNDAGNILAIGNPNYNNGYNLVTVYRYVSDTTWHIIGNNSGQTGDNFSSSRWYGFGHALDFNGSGNTLVIGEPYYDTAPGGGTNFGQNNGKNKNILNIN